jgi:LacI family transcriptional regulator
MTTLSIIICAIKAWNVVTFRKAITMLPIVALLTISGKEVSLKNITIEDVARCAQVSLKTVSRVLNNEANVRPATAEKVRIAITELGYRPNAAARALASTRSYFIGIIAANPSPHYILALQRGGVKACREKGYHLAVEEIDLASPTLAEDFEQILLTARFDGIFIAPPATDSTILLDLLDKYQVRYVRLDPATEFTRSDSIVANDEHGVEQVVDHLWALGHRRFGLINGPTAHRASHVRRDAFLARIVALSGTTDIVQEQDGEFLFKSGFTAAEALLNQDTPPTAIFACNDEMAAGVMAAAAQMGIKVSQQLSVVGFDDSEVAGYTWPPLTTVRQPIEEFAYMAVNRLIAPAEAPAILSTSHSVDLVIRGSTGQPQNTP